MKKNWAKTRLGKKIAQSRARKKAAGRRTSERAELPFTIKRRYIKTEKTLKRGITETKINIHTLGNKEIRRAYGDIFKPLIKDDNIFEYFMQHAEDFSSKYSDKFTYVLKLEGEDMKTGTNEQICIWEDFLKTLTDIRQLYQTHELAKGVILTSMILKKILNSKGVNEKQIRFIKGGSYRITRFDGIMQMTVN